MRIRNLYKEEWKTIKFDEKISKIEIYKISNYGRTLNCKNEKDFLRKKTFINGYETISLKQTTGKGTSRYIHKLVAQHFLKKENENQKFVIHLNYNKEDNSLENLKWATKREKELHQFSNPNWENVVKTRSKNIGKLSVGKVKIIKRQLKNKNNRISMIAKRFGVSDTQIHRIKSGENWAEV